MTRVIEIRIDTNNIAKAQCDLLYLGDNLEKALKTANREMDYWLLNGFSVVEISGWVYDVEYVVLRNKNKYYKIIVEDGVELTTFDV